MAIELRVFVRKDCIINPEASPTFLGALVGLVAPKLIEMAIGGVAGLLKKAGAKDTVTGSSSEVANLYQADDKQTLSVNPNLGCLIAVWGDFDETSSNPTPSSDKALKALEKAKLVPKNKDIRVIFEAAIRRVDDDTAFYLETRHFSVRNFVGKSGKDERAFIATLNVTTPNATPDGQTIAVGNIDLGRRKRNTFVTAHGEPRDRSNLMPWNQISQASKLAYQADVAAGQAAGREYMPVSFNLSLSETADGVAFLTTVGELLDGAREKAAEELSKAIIPAERAKAEAEQIKEAGKLYDDELAAELDVRKKQKAYDEAEAADKPIKRAELEIAKRKLERVRNLRIAAGLPSPPPIPES